MIQRNPGNRAKSPSVEHRASPCSIANAARVRVRDEIRVYAGWHARPGSLERLALGEGDRLRNVVDAADPQRPEGDGLRAEGSRGGLGPASRTLRPSRRTWLTSAFRPSRRTWLTSAFRLP